MAAEALTAWQLCVRLMCPGPRDQLRRLLAFMATAAAPHACLLHKQIANRTFVCRTFQKAIVQSSELTRGQCEALVLFLMDSHRQLFKTPGCLTEAVHKTLRDRQNGKDPDSIATFTFCQQVTPQQYEDQREAATGAGLRALLGAVVRSDRRRLRDFQKLHPAVFLQPCSGGGGGGYTLSAPGVTTAEPV